MKVSIAFSTDIHCVYDLSIIPFITFLKVVAFLPLYRCCLMSHYGSRFFKRMFVAVVFASAFHGTLGVVANATTISVLD